MATIYVDGLAYAVDGGENLLHACLGLGLNLPYFCWHPAMGSVGACRQCAVKQFKDERDATGRIVMACMTPAADGTRIAIGDPEAVAFRAAIVEGLMTNHPHDCPVCDEGGECHLQDMTVMTGHDYRRYVFPKRTFRNQHLGPLVNHEMNRCIQCYRCVRFYREYAGGRDLDAFALRNVVFFGRHDDGVLESEFSGNLVEVCPTGVFTDATLKRHYTRKWDLQFAPAVCVHCGLGCNVSTAERYGTLRRIVNRYHHEVNGYFLCDRGRFGYEFVNSGRRVRQPQIRRDGRLDAAGRDEALARAAGALAQTGRAIGIGSPRASLEANFALRALVGADRFSTGLADADQRLAALMLDVLRDGPAPPASLRDAEQADAVLILGEDVTNVAPRLALSLRQAVRQQPLRRADALKIPRWLDHAVREAVQEDRGPLFIATPEATKLDDIAAAALRAAPDDVARLGLAVAHALDGAAPLVHGLPPERTALAARIADALRAAARPLVVAGPSCHNDSVIQAAANVARALHAIGRPARLAFTTPECNTLGVALLGGRSIEAVARALDEAPTTVIVLENDLFRRAPAARVAAMLDRAAHVVVLDTLSNATTARADVLLPAGSFAESDGTFVSSEGRAQRAFQAVVPEGDIRESWRWLQELRPDAGARWRTLDEVTAALAADATFARLPAVAPDAAFRMAGAKIPRSPHRYSGRTAMHADVNVSEPAPPDDPDSALAFSMEGSPAQPPPALTPFFWSPGWNSIQSVNKFQQEIGGPLRGGDPGLRLIEPPPAARGGYFVTVPPAFGPRPDEWLLVPLYRIFGSEELSAEAPGPAELAPVPALRLHPSDADRLHLAAGDVVHVTGDGMALDLPVAPALDLPAGLAGLVITGALTPGLAQPAWVRLSRMAS